MKIEDIFKGPPPGAEFNVPSTFTHIGGVCATKFEIPKGGMIMKHAHDYDHISILAFGVARVVTPDGETVHQGGDVIVIKAGVQHAIIAAIDCIWFCIQAVEE